MAGQKLSEPYQRAVISVTAMAKAVNLSRARFYELVEQHVFLAPVHCIFTHKPMYLREMVETNVQVRATGIGVNGQYILFYERTPRQSLPPQRKNRPDRITSVLEGLKGLGVDTTATNVQAALASVYPAGTDGHDDTVVLRAVYRHLRRPKAV